MTKSPLLWAGGKSRAMPFVLPELPKAQCLIEPFVGGGSVFLNTSYSAYILCDSNIALINFFDMVKHHTDELIKHASFIFSSSNGEDYYFARRKEFNTINKSVNGKLNCWLTASRIHYAALFLYLNRHCFNGLYRVNLQQEFNVPYGHRAKPIFPEAEIRAFAEKAWKDNAVFVYGDFRNAIPTYAALFPTAAIYCDPPYLAASKTASFTAYGKPFTADDHRDLVAALISARNQHKCLPVISGSATPETHEIYRLFNLNAFDVRRSVGAKSRNLASEVIGSLRVCDCCDWAGGGGCPDCGPCCGDATYSEMVAAGAFEELEAF